MIPTSDFRPDDTNIRVGASIARANGLPYVSDLILMLRDRLVEAEAEIVKLREAKSNG